MGSKRKLLKAAGKAGGEAGGHSSSKKRHKGSGGAHTAGKGQRKPARAGGRKPAPLQQQPPPPPAGGDGDGDDDDEEVAVSEEDLEFVQQYGASLGFLESLDEKQLGRTSVAKQQRKQAAAAAPAAAAGADAGPAGAGSDADADGAGGAGDEDEDEEDEDGAAAYERRPRASEQQHKGPSTQGLPIKTAAGEVVFAPNKRQQRLLQRAAAHVQVEGVSVQDTLLSQQQQGGAAAEEEEQDDEDAGRERDAAAAAAAAGARKAAAQQQQQQQEQQQQQQQQQQHPDLPPALRGLLSLSDGAARREGLKQQMALAAQHLLAEPDKHIGPGLRLLMACAADADGVVVRLSLLSLLAVFRDVLPGYRIRGLTEEEQEARVSKEVQALRDFEQALLKGYQAYLKALLAASTTGPSLPAGAPGHASLATARVAVRCMGQLLVARPGFNYSGDLLQALVPLMMHRDADVAQLATASIQQLLMEDVQGTTSLQAVQLVADLVRRRRCVLDPAVVRCLLVLRFAAVTPTSQGGEGAGRADAPAAGKKGKKGRKRKKSDLDRDLEEAEAGPDRKELELLQSQMLEALFEIFFRVLKHCSTATSAAAAGAGEEAAAGAAADDGGGGGAGSLLQQPWPAARVHARFPLLQPTLAGLGRYSHLISVDYFNDLMGVLQELLAAGALPVRERVCVLLAALDVLRGQGEALTIDRRAFYTHLYQTLLLAPQEVLFEAPGGGGRQQQQQQQQQQAWQQADEAEAEQELQREAQQALDAVRISQQGWESVVRGAGGAAGGAPQRAAPAPADAAQPTSVLLLRCLEQQLLGVKQTDMGRLAAFVKRLAGLMLAAAPAEALGAACLLWRLVRRYPRLAGLLEWEGGAPVGGQQYAPGCADPSDAGALAAALWELPLAAQHYHPHVAAAARALLTLTPGGGGGQAAGAVAGGADGGGGGRPGGGATAAAGLGIIAGAAGPQQVAATYDAVRRGGFRPPPAVPRGVAGAGGSGKEPAGSSRAGMAARAAAAARPWTSDLQQAVAAQQARSAAAAAAGGVRQPGAPDNQRRPHKHQQHIQQQQQQRAHTAAKGNGVAAAAAEEADMEAVAAAARQHFLLNRQHERNQQLRQEVALTARKVQLFREHLIRRRQQLDRL